MTDERAKALAELLPALDEYIRLGEAIDNALQAQQLGQKLPQVAARSAQTALVKLAAAEILARAPATSEGVSKRLAGLATPAREAA